MKRQGRTGQHSKEWKSSRYKSKIRCAAVLLGQAKESEAYPDFMTLLDDPCPIMRNWAATSLGHLGDRRALPTLLEILQLRPNRSVVEAIGKLGDDSTVPILIADASSKIGKHNHFRAIEQITGLSLDSIREESKTYSYIDRSDRLNTALRKWWAENKSQSRNGLINATGFNRYAVRILPLPKPR